MYITSEQKQFVNQYCSEFLEDPYQFTRARPKNNVRVFAVHKVRWKGVEPTESGKLLESITGVRDVENRSVIIDWSGGEDSVYVIPVNGWRWIPAIVSEALDTVPSLLLKSIIEEQIEQCGTLQELTSGRGNIALVGINKFVTIRTSAFPSFSKLIAALQN